MSPAVRHRAGLPGTAVGNEALGETNRNAVGVRQAANIEVAVRAGCSRTREPTCSYYSTTIFYRFRFSFGMAPSSPLRTTGPVWPRVSGWLVMLPPMHWGNSLIVASSVAAQLLLLLLCCRFSRKMTIFSFG